VHNTSEGRRAGAHYGRIPQGLRRRVQRVLTLLRLSGIS
jgi:hypothetical protein